MTLSDHDLTQLNTSYLDTLPEDNLRSLSKKLLVDLKEARERLNRTPETSSLPPSSREPWKSADTKETPHTTEAIVVDENAVEPEVPRTEEASAACERHRFCPFKTVNPWLFIAQAVANRRRNLAVPVAYAGLRLLGG